MKIIIYAAIIFNLLAGLIASYAGNYAQAACFFSLCTFLRLEASD